MKTVEMIVLDYIENKVFIYRNLKYSDFTYANQIDSFLEKNHSKYSSWMIREKIEIVELKDKV